MLGSAVFFFFAAIAMGAKALSAKAAATNRIQNFFMVIPPYTKILVIEETL
jgi:hypothetical protein